MIHSTCNEVFQKNELSFSMLTIVVVISEFQGWCNYYMSCNINIANFIQSDLRIMTSKKKLHWISLIVDSDSDSDSKNDSIRGYPVLRTKSNTFEKSLMIWQRYVTKNSHQFVLKWLTETMNDQNRKQLRTWFVHVMDVCVCLFLLKTILFLCETLKKTQKYQLFLFRCYSFYLFCISLSFFNIS